MTRHACMAALLVLAAAGAGSAADLTKVERRIGREPKYRTPTQRYALLVFGPEARDRVWLVKDGDTLYVDRNGNGDLTEPGERVAAKTGGSADEGRRFEVDTLAVGSSTHRRLHVGVDPLRQWMLEEYARRPDMLAALKADAHAEVLHLSVEVEAPRLKEKGYGRFLAGPIDLNGPLVLAAKPANAPIIHCGGPLAVTFFESRPTLRRNRSTQFTLVVGTPGLGAGTFSMVGYEEIIPTSTHPVAEILFPPAKAGSDPIKKQFEFKERC